MLALFSDQMADQQLFRLSPVFNRMILALECLRSFGAVWLGWSLWRALKLHELLEELLPRHVRQRRGRR